MLIRESFWKTVCEGRESEDAHRAFLRYGLGTFEKEKVSLKRQKGKLILLTGYDHVWLVYSLSTLLDGVKHVKGVLIPPDAERKKKLTAFLADEDIQLEKTFGKKFTLAEQDFTREAYERLIRFLIHERVYPFLTIHTQSGLVKVKKTTFPKPKDDLAKRENFLRLEAPEGLWDDFLSAFPFTSSVQRAYQLNATLTVEDIQYDEHLLEEDPERAREESKRYIKAVLGVKRDARVETHTCTFTI